MITLHSAWAALVLCAPLLIAIGMAVALLVERRRDKRRAKRLHQPIRNWWELEVK